MRLKYTVLSKKLVDAMFLANGLPKVNFPQQIVTKEFKNLLHQSKDNIIESISTPQENVVEEIITANENLVEHIRTTNVMETEQTDHGFKRALKTSPEAPKKKREMATTSTATSSSGNIAMQEECPTPAPKPSNLSLSLSPSPPMRTPHRESN